MEKYKYYIGTTLNVLVAIASAVATIFSLVWLLIAAFVPCLCVVLSALLWHVTGPVQQKLDIYAFRHKIL